MVTTMLIFSVFPCMLMQFVCVPCISIISILWPVSVPHVIENWNMYLVLQVMPMVPQYGVPNPVGVMQPAAPVSVSSGPPPAGPSLSGG